MRFGQKLVIISGFVLAIVASIATMFGSYIDDNTEKYVIVMIFAYQLMATPGDN